MRLKGKTEQQKEMEAKQQAENAWNDKLQEFQSKHADVIWISLRRTRSL
jgi:hypothetical protein